jgi:hypothetical protein
MTQTADRYAYERKMLGGLGATIGAASDRARG